MKWNWQQSDWPEFSWDCGRIRKAEEQFLLEGGMLAGVIRHLNRADHERLAVDAMSAEAVTTSEIEGEILDRVSVQSSIRRQLGLDGGKRRSKFAEQGIAELMVHLNRTFTAPLTSDALFEWHRMIFKGRKDLEDIGRYRRGRQPMQVVSGAAYQPKVHFEAPPSSAVPKEMTRFLKWFERTSPAGPEPLPALTRAAIAHLYFESIHPFEDGNGRIGRAISEKALAQALGQPPLIPLAATILIRRRAYYENLEPANKRNHITQWIAWFGGIALEAQRRGMARVEFTIDKTRLLDRLKGEINPRQEKALERMLREGPEGFKGGLSAGKYAAITGASPATATRDLAELVEKGALDRAGERRHARYTLALSRRPVQAVTIAQNGDVK